MPEMDMPNVNISIAMPEDATMEEAVALSDEVLSRMEQVDGIATAGAMMSGSNSLLGGSGGSYDVTVYLTLEDENAPGAKIGKEIEALCTDLNCQVTSSSAMMDMSMLTGSGVSMRIYAEDTDVLQRIHYFLIGNECCYYRRIQ